MHKIPFTLLTWTMTSRTIDNVHYWQLINKNNWTQQLQLSNLNTISCLHTNLAFVMHYSLCSVSWLCCQRCRVVHVKQYLTRDTNAMSVSSNQITIKQQQWVTQQKVPPNTHHINQCTKFYKYTSVLSQIMLLAKMNDKFSMSYSVLCCALP